MKHGQKYEEEKEPEEDMVANDVGVIQSEVADHYIKKFDRASSDS